MFFYRTRISFPYEKAGLDFFKIIADTFKIFVPSIVEVTDTKNNVSFFYKDFDWNELTSFEKNPHIEFKDENKQVLSIVPTARTLTVHISSFNLYGIIEFINEIYLKEKFIIGNIFDSEFVSWQCQKRISIYKQHNKPYKHLKKTIDPIFEEEIIDISKNPGRSEMHDLMWLQASWITFFGEPFYKWVPKEVLLKFPYAFEIKESASRVLYIQLYKNIEESDTKENLKIMQSFRDWLNMDELAKT